MSEHRRVVHVLITRQFFEFFLKEPKDDLCLFYRTEGIPNDAKLVNIQYADKFDVWCAYFEHPSFDEVPCGDLIPEIRPTITTYWI